MTDHDAFDAGRTTLAGSHILRQGEAGAYAEEVARALTKLRSAQGTAAADMVLANMLVAASWAEGRLYRALGEVLKDSTASAKLREHYPDATALNRDVFAVVNMLEILCLESPAELVEHTKGKIEKLKGLEKALVEKLKGLPADAERAEEFEGYLEELRARVAELETDLADAELE